MNNKEIRDSIKHIDELIAEKKKAVQDKATLEYVELLFIRSTMITEGIAEAVKVSFDKVTKEYSNRFEVMTKEYNERFNKVISELRGLRKDLGYSNGN